MVKNFIGRAIIYVRVSTDKQADNYSIESQIDACQRYATEHGFIVVASLQDVMSGEKLDRPGLTKARELIRRKDADVLIVYCSDRLSRNVAHWLFLRDELREADVTLHTVTKGQSQDTPEGNLFDIIESAFAEYERLKIQERMSRGRKKKLENGNVIGGIKLPFGLVYTDERRSQVAIDEDAAQVVRMIFRWYLHEGLGACAIVDRLSDQRILTPSDRCAYNLKAKKKRGVGEWCTTTVSDILRNPLYKGDYIWNQDGETIVVPVPAIIDAVTWEAVAHKREERKKFSRRNAHHLYLLSGRVRCGICGAACTGTLLNKKRRYYRCLRNYHHSMFAATPCKLQMFRDEALEGAVWDWIDTEVLNEAHIRDAVSGREDEAVVRREQLEQERATFIRQREDLDNRILRLIQLYTAGIVEMEEISAQKNQLDTARGSTIREIERLDLAIQGFSTMQEQVDQLCALVRVIRERIKAGLSPETKRKIIDLLDTSVKLSMDDRERKIAEVVCQLTLDEARLLVGGVGDEIVTAIGRHSGTRSSAAA